MLERLLTRLRKLFRALGSSVLVKPLVWHRVLAGTEHFPVLERDLATIVDIGANRGQFALACRSRAPHSRIFSFEPLQAPAVVFRSIFARDDRVVLHQAAIGPRSERREMHISAREDSSSLLPITGVQSRIFPGTGEVSTIDVNVAPLDTFIGLADILAPAMLKLDVQGYEYEVLCGCESLLAGFDTVYCECSFVELYSGQKLAAEVIQWLADNGFRIKGIYNLTFDGNGRAVQADFLFTRS